MICIQELAKFTLERSCFTILGPFYFCGCDNFFKLSNENFKSPTNPALKYRTTHRSELLLCGRLQNATQSHQTEEILEV